MRICYLLHQGNMHSGGQGVYLHYITREVAALGHEVHVIVGPPYPDIAPGITVDKLETFNLFDVFGTFNFGFFHNRHPRQFFRPLNLYELTTTRMGMFSAMAAFSMRAYDRLRELVQQRRFDIVHDVQVLGYGTLLVKAGGLPVVANVHHPLDVDRRNALLQAKSLREKIRWIMFYPFFMQHIVARKVDRIITGSDNSSLSVQKAFGLPASHIQVIHDGVDIDIFRPLEDVPKMPDTILFVGNSEDRNKGARYLIEALHLLRDEIPFRLIMVDKDRKALQMVPELVRKYSLGTQVLFTGRVPKDELVRYYNRATLLVSPSLYEGFGLPAAEAMACGLPVVATTAGAFPEVIADGETGWLVPAGDAHALAEAIRRMMADPALRQRMGEAGRRRIEERFTWRETARKTIALYEEICSRRSTQRQAVPGA